MDNLQHHDLQWALRRTPKVLLEIMKRPSWAGRIFVGGGFLRSIVAGEPVNDVDVFVTDKTSALALAHEINCSHFGIDILKPSADDTKRLNRFVETDNAYTITHTKPEIQIIHRWTFDSAQAVSDSFDFTCCCAAFWYDWVRMDEGPKWQSICDPLFYPDVAAKRLTYRKPVRNEDAGGSMLRVLKYYQKGYRIPLDSLAAVIARLVNGIEVMSEDRFAWIITGLLREVDPAIDPEHIAHLPSSSADEFVPVDAEGTKR